MRSLFLLSETRAALFPAGAAGSDGSRALTTIDTETDAAFISSGSAARSTVYRVASDSSVAEVASFPNETYETSAPYEIVGLQYLPELQALCVMLAGGDIVLIRTDDVRDGDFENLPQEIVGTVDSGILSMEWSPDHELVIIVTGTGTLLEMTKDFDVITEVPIHVEATGDATQVNVGWGRKETQFHGSEGKQAAQKAATPLTGKVLSDADDMRPRISWRGDGAFFACSAVDPNGERRVVRMYDRECVLQYTSEPVPKLEHALSWRPSGNLIAATQQLPHRHDVVFFEKNGLRHGDFALRDKNAVVVEMTWNLDSTVLAIWLMFPEAEVVSSCVQLWSMMNYHWYLKQEIRPTTQGDSIAGVNWDPERALRLHIATLSGLYRRLDYAPDNFVSSSLASDNPATVAVIDGASLLLTPFRHLNVPPPMSALQLSLPAPISYVAFGPGSAGDDFAVLLCDSTVQLFKSGSVSKPVRVPTHMGSFLLAVDSQTVTYRQLVWMTESHVAAIAYNEDTGTDSVVILSLDAASAPAAVDDNSALLSISVAGRREICFARDSSARTLSRLQYSIPLGILYAQAVDGQIAEIDIADGAATLEMRAALPTMCPWVTVVDFASQKADDSQRDRVYVGLSERNKLYANTVLIAADCTSFYLHNDFMIFTTFTHAARFVSLNCPASDFKITDASASASPFDEHFRRVERGSKIVVAVPNDTSLVLQMPRGNLETVYPRALVLAVVRRAIVSVDYRTAFILCRKHRIDMNFLVDCDRAGFEKNTEQFVRDVADPDYLNLFISSLRDQDVTVTMYAGMKNTTTATTAPILPTGTQQPPSQLSSYALKKLGRVDGKVNAICDLFRTALEAVDAPRYVHSILTTDVKKTPPDLETAMRRILTIKSSGAADAADAALKYVIFLADVDKLYDVALGMYDFPLALMVAQHSQKDPREYLPFLSELQKLEPNYQRFRIDDHLGKRDTALAHLANAGDEHYDACLAYADRHGIYKSAMRVFKDDPSKRRDALRLYAADLDQRSDYADAALLYHAAGDHRLAIACYVRACMWREAFALAPRAAFTKAETVSMAVDLADELARRLQFSDAARVLHEHAGRADEAVRVLVQGGHWAEAERVACATGNEAMLESCVAPGVKEAFDRALGTVRDMTAELEKRADRLARFREEKARLLALALARGGDEGEGENDSRLDDIDMFSDTTSMATTRITGRSAFTGRTGLTSIGSHASTRTARTTKGKRKAEMKRRTGRDKAFEDEYLITCLRGLIERSNNMRPDILALVRALLVHDREDDARAIQHAFRDLVAKLAARMEEIFRPDPPGWRAPEGESMEEYKARVLDHLGNELAVPPPPPLARAADPPPKLSDAQYGVPILD
ncbi:hypothetical protein HDU86_002001 [Geranomyces michiganensis]|nr:hypothetical protein HDU86_002001 [Geranomyces michiganensis]